MVGPWWSGTGVWTSYALATRDGDPALVQKGAILAAGFHPELQHGVHPVVARFAGMVREHAGAVIG